MATVVAGNPKFLGLTDETECEYIVVSIEVRIEIRE